MAVVTFLGQEREVAFISGPLLTRLAAGLHALAQQAGVSNEAAILAVAAGQYPSLVLMALQGIIDNLTEDLALTKAERLVYGVMGQLVGCSVDETANAPLSEQHALFSAVWAQEAQTQSGKALIGTLAKFGQTPTANTTTESSSGSDSTTKTGTTGESARSGGRKRGGSTPSTSPS